MTHLNLELSCSLDIFPLIGEKDPPNMFLVAMYAFLKDIFIVLAFKEILTTHKIT